MGMLPRNQKATAIKVVVETETKFWKLGALGWELGVIGFKLLARSSKLGADY